MLTAVSTNFTWSDSMRDQLRTFLKAGALITALLVPVSGHAQFYLGGGVGESEFNDLSELRAACATVGANCSVDDTDTGFKVFAGYRFARYIAFEGGYIDMGESVADATVPVTATANLSAEGGFVAILPQIPVGTVGTIFGRVGLSAVKAELTASGAGQSFRDSSGAAALVLGFGGEVHLSEQVSIRAEWERHSFDEALDIAGVEIEAPDIELISASLIFRF
jgi:OmpA-OmpF porin, OOP family